MFTFRREAEVRRQLDDYLQVAKHTVELFQKAIGHVMSNGIDPAFEVMTHEIEESEQNCDDLRRSIEKLMFTKDLLPETREDLMEILERLDHIPNACEDAAHDLLLQRVVPVRPIHADLAELVKAAVQAFDLCAQAVADCFGSMRDTERLKREIDDWERIGDSIERKMIAAVFQNPSLDSGERLLQKELIRTVGSICDLCEHLADRILITTIKRKI